MIASCLTDESVDSDALDSKVTYTDDAFATAIIQALRNEERIVPSKFRERARTLGISLTDCSFKEEQCT